MTTLALALVAATGAGAAVWRWPVGLAIAASRARLSFTGLRRHSRRGRFGTEVWWSGGGGPVLVLIHGMNDQAGSWARVAGRLTRAWHVVVPDLAGHGASGPTAGRLGLDTILDALDDLLAHVAPDRPLTLVGNSMGAWMTQLVALRRPDRVARVVLECGGGLSFGDSAPDLLPSTRDEARHFFVRVIGPHARPLPGFVLDHVVRRLRSCPLRRVLDTDWTRHHVDDLVGDWAVPTDVIWGDADGVLPIDYARRLVSAVPGARLHVIPGAAHLPHRDRPGQFLATLGRLLESPPEVTTGRRLGHAPRPFAPRDVTRPDPGDSPHAAR